jgi:hypothetical protein
MSLTIPKGTFVTVRTDNGGEITAQLREDHQHTFDVVFEQLGIPSWRVVWVRAHESREAALEYVNRGSIDNCDCGHPWSQHVKTANGAYACKCFGCGCRDAVFPRLFPDLAP